MDLKLTQLNIQGFLPLYKSQKFFDDGGDRNIINIQLVPLNKKKQQVERAFKVGKLYLIGGTHGFCLIKIKVPVTELTGLHKIRFVFKTLRQHQRLK